MASGPVPFIDGHNDVLLALRLAGDGARPFLARRSEGHLDLERAREGGFAAGFFAVFVLPETEEERAATQIPNRKPPYALPLCRVDPDRIRGTWGRHDRRPARRARGEWRSARGGLGPRRPGRARQPCGALRARAALRRSRLEPAEASRFAFRQRRTSATD